MRSEDLFLAIGAVEETRLARSEQTLSSIEETEDKTMKVRPTRIIRNILVAAIIISMLVVTASAFEVVRSWFVDYFSDESEMPLSEAQVEAIEQNAQDISQRQTCNGYTMELKSVLTDGYNMFIAVGITAPEDVYLDRTIKEGYDSEVPVIWLGENSSFEIGDRGYSMTWNMSDDGDGLSNTHNIVYLMSVDNGVFNKGETIKIHIEDLYAEYTNDAYGAELEEKYGYLPKLGQMTDEEAEKLYPVELLTEGTWDFEIVFEEITTPFVEVLEQPVDYIMQAMADADADQVDVNTKITSIRISPIGVVCEYEAVDYPIINGVWGNIVMKNGDAYDLNGDTVGGFGDTSSHGMFGIPIVLEEIDHIELKGGTKLPMPELPAE